MVCFQGDFYSYSSLNGSVEDVSLLNIDKPFKLIYKDFLTGPKASKDQTWGSFGVDHATGPGHVSDLIGWAAAKCKHVAAASNSNSGYKHKTCTGHVSGNCKCASACMKLGAAVVCGVWWLLPRFWQFQLSPPQAQWATANMPLLATGKLISCHVCANPLSAVRLCDTQYLGVCIITC
eukprot:GHRR01024599.1.p1 GENE.GHRR01024599.1~~GHRR01024599.1.p1  ORF type:complete len:178 (-),score=47.86 GHRR01024599.1:995-1528(-)